MYISRNNILQATFIKLIEIILKPIRIYIKYNKLFYCLKLE